eukprot:TRINITY_DN19675_c0_g1_i1.p1 TRINITY_DN19675_c0_g1~~TRINITY_DN19675_c0_g1_i1.p1  ORF type:complete len:236 (+),score=43.29 TRINITY_DN19675_c0_g1_i1:29-709(+)
MFPAVPWVVAKRRRRQPPAGFCDDAERDGSLDCQPLAQQLRLAELCARKTLGDAENDSRTRAGIEATALSAELSEATFDDEVASAAFAGYLGRASSTQKTSMPCELAARFGNHLPPGATTATISRPPRWPPSSLSICAGEKDARRRMEKTGAARVSAGVDRAFDVGQLGSEADADADLSVEQLPLAQQQRLAELCVRKACSRTSSEESFRAARDGSEDETLLKGAC